MILLFFHIAIFLFGFLLTKEVVGKDKKPLLILIASISIGILTSLPLTYILAVLFQKQNDPLLLAVSCFISFVAVLSIIKRKEYTHSSIASLFSREHGVDLIVIGVCFFVSSYIMGKSFKLGQDGTLLIARNALFDFGHGLSIIRSMSWGSNIPYSSPFVAGTEHIYHFMFSFWAALFEHFGLSITLAVNIPSYSGFTLFLSVIYMLGKEWFGKRIVGMLAAFLTIFHGGLMFVPFFQKYGLSFSSVWKNPNYLFNGPFDGSPYSLFVTLNVFVNQRQLGISLVFVFLIYYMFTLDFHTKRLTTKKLIMYGIFVGCCVLWHLLLTIGLGTILVTIMVFQKELKKCLIFILSAGLCVFLFVQPWMGSFYNAFVTISAKGTNSPSLSPHKTISFQGFFEFIFFNFGVALIFFGIGFIKRKKISLYALVLFSLTGLVTFITSRSGITDQKYLSILLPIISLYIASGLVFIWQKNINGKVMVIILFPIIVLSGIIDFMVVKNDYLYPVPETKSGGIVNWIRNNTDKKSVFIAPQEMFDPVTLAGRKNYYGFFQQALFLNNSDKYRGDHVKNIFDVEDIESLQFAMQDTNSNYLLLPLKAKSDFHYTIRWGLFNQIFPEVLNTNEYLLFRIKK